VNAKATLDLIIIDVPEDLHVPTVSEPADAAPPWNQSTDSLLEATFVFAEDYLQDDGAMVVIHPFQVDAKSTILGYCVEYGFETRKEWLCMNHLHLCSPLNLTLSSYQSPHFPLILQ
jgi:tRNA G10  N-methylase Trm11